MSRLEPPVVITGATGRLGGRIARRLAGRGMSQRLAVRAPQRAPQLPGATAVACSYGRPDQLRRALADVETVLMVSAPEGPDRVDLHRTFIDAAVAAGVERIVYISFHGASPTATFTLARDHWTTEEHLRAVGVRAVVLRDNLYLDFLPELIEPDGTIRGPAGSGRVAAVAQDDIADAAAAVLAEPAAHDERVYELTGREALTLSEVADIVSRTRGSDVNFADQSVAEAYATRAGRAPGWQLDAWVSTYTAIAAGELADITDDVATLTGHPPLNLEELLGPTRRGAQR